MVVGNATPIEGSASRFDEVSLSRDVVVSRRGV